MENTDIVSRLAQIKAEMQAGRVQINFEDMLEQHYRRWVQRGDTAIDIGAHTGRHLIPLAQCVGEAGLAIAFEPLPFAFKILQEKCKEKPYWLNKAACGRFLGMSEFTYAQGTPEESGLKQRSYNRPDLANPTTIKVAVDVLDRFAVSLKAISFIKIDVEGGEMDCLEGGRGTLARTRPLVSVEYGFDAYSAYGHSKDTLFSFANSEGFVLYDIFLNPLRTLTDWRVACDSIYWDYLMVPAEKEAAFIKRVVQHEPPQPSPTPWSISRIRKGIARRIRRS